MPSSAGSAQETITVEANTIAVQPDSGEQIGDLRALVFSLGYLYFRTPLTEQLVVGTPRGDEVLTCTPMNRFGELEEVIGAAVLLASDAASFVTGSVLAVDGGYLASSVNR